MTPLQTLERVAAELAADLERLSLDLAESLMEEAPSYVHSVVAGGEDIHAVVRQTTAVMIGSLTKPDLLRGHETEIKRNAHERSVTGVGLETLLEVIALQRHAVIRAFEARLPDGSERVVLLAERRLQRSYSRLVLGITAGYVDGAHERWQEQQDMLERLVAIARAVNVSLDVSDVAQGGMSATLEAMQLDAATLWMPTDSGFAISYSFGLTWDEDTSLRAGHDARSWLIDKAAGSPGPVQTGLRPERPLGVGGLTSAVAIALRAHGRLLGVMALASRAPRRLKASELTFLVAVADHMSVALARALQHRQEARTDFLTGLANLPEFERALDRAIASAERFKRPLSLVMLDLDNLKLINDNFGHHAGDIAIRSLADVLRRAVRATDTCARLGGDEFALAMPETDTQQAEEVVRRVRIAVQGEAERTSFPLAVSIGLVQWQPGLDRAKFMKMADVLLYREKRRHRAANQPGAVGPAR